MKKTYLVTGKLEMFEDMIAPWTYVFIPFEKVPDVRPGGWGSIPVEVSLGKTVWVTSMFPLKKEGYFLPVKKSVLKKENIRPPDVVAIKYSVAR